MLKLHKLTLFDYITLNISLYLQTLINTSRIWLCYEYVHDPLNDGFLRNTGIELVNIFGEASAFKPGIIIDIIFN